MRCGIAPKISFTRAFAFCALFVYWATGLRARALHAVCDQVKMGVTAIFGPSDPLLGAHITSICDALDIPYLDARVDTSPSDDQRQSAFGGQRAPAQRLGGASITDADITEGDDDDDGLPMDSAFDAVAFASTAAATQTDSHTATKRSRQQLAIHLNPSQALINNAFMDVMRFLNWTKIAIIYEKRHGTYTIYIYMLV